MNENDLWAIFWMSLFSFLAVVIAAFTYHEIGWQDKEKAIQIECIKAGGEPTKTGCHRNK